MSVRIQTFVEEPCELFDPEGKSLGFIKSGLSFNDVRVQIMENALEGYYIEFKGEKYAIDADGRPIGNWPHGLFDTNSKLLVKLIIGRNKCKRSVDKEIG